MRYAFLNLLDHPRGNFMLKQLVEGGIISSLIIEEDSNLALQGRTLIEEEIGPENLIRQNGSVFFESGAKVPFITVRDHNDYRCS
jgi:hypothetical protein